VIISVSIIRGNIKVEKFSFFLFKFVILSVYYDKMVSQFRNCGAERELSNYWVLFYYFVYYLFILPIRNSSSSSGSPPLKGDRTYEIEVNSFQMCVLLIFNSTEKPTLKG
jgi:hypothetical protein